MNTGKNIKQTGELKDYPQEYWLAGWGYCKVHKELKK
jgi:hypothetical protein